MSQSITAPFLCSLSHPQDWEVVQSFLKHLREKHSLYYFSGHNATPEEREGILTHPFASLITCFVSQTAVVDASTLEQLLWSQVGRETPLPLIPIFLEDVPMTSGLVEWDFLESTEKEKTVEISDSFRMLAGKMYEKITTLPVLGSYDHVSHSALEQWKTYLEQKGSPLTSTLCYLMFREIIQSLNSNFIYLKYYSKESLPDFLEDFQLRISNTVTGARRPYIHAHPITNKEIPEFFGSYNLHPEEFATYHPLTREECVIEGGRLVSVQCEAPRIVIPFSLREIGDHAFAYNSTLEFLLLPEGILSVGYGAFGCCTNLQYVFLPDSLQELGQSAFYSCVSLKEIFIPNRVRILHPYTFYGCIQLRRVMLPPYLTAIEKNCFELCCHLGEISFPSALQRIGSRGFFSSGLGRVEFPMGLVHVEEEAFGSCCFLARVTINPNLEILGEHAFFNGYALTRVDIPAQNRLTQLHETAFSTAGPFEVFHYVLEE